MFANNLQIRGGHVDVVDGVYAGQPVRDFVLIEQSGRESTRLNKASTLTEPQTLRIAHTQSGKGNAVVDRHLVQFNTVESMGVGATNACTVGLTVTTSRFGTFATQEVAAQLRLLFNFFGIDDGEVILSPGIFEERVGAFLRGEA